MFGTHIGGTATGNIWMTATLAVITMGMMVANGLRLGGKHYLAHFCPGPAYMAPLLVPVEIIGLIAKVFALAVRLFANMTAGHKVIVTFAVAELVGGVWLWNAGTWQKAVAALPFALSVVLLAFELFVAFIQSEKHPGRAM